MAVPEDAEASLTAKFQALFPHLDERQRRLVAGAEARVLGHGGIRVVARAAGMREGTVSDGVAELESGAGPLGRVRRAGGGRKRAADLDPGLVPALLALVEPDERGDPMSPLRWTTKSLRTLAQELTAAGHKVGPDTVAELLREQGFSLQGNAKTIEGKQSPDRDAQFRYLNEQVKGHQQAGRPGHQRGHQEEGAPRGLQQSRARLAHRPGNPVAVNDHDFPNIGVGKAVPYGIYDLGANTGWVNVGTDHDTAVFAVESIRRWWNAMAGLAYPRAGRLLITADAGGSNGYRLRLWKARARGAGRRDRADRSLCATCRRAHRSGTRSSTGCSRAITMNWRGRPLTSHEVVVNSIAATTTGTGLRVVAELDTNTYDTGTKVSDRKMDALPVTRHDWHGDWNYTIRPEHFPQLPTGPDPFDQMSPDLAWLCRPALTGMPAAEWHSLIGTLLGLHEQQRETALDKRRGHRPRLVNTGLGTGRRPMLTLADRLMAVILHQRHGLPQVAIAALFGVRPETLNRRIRDTRELLKTADHTISPAGHRLANLDDLHAFATANDNATVIEIKQAC